MSTSSKPTSAKARADIKGWRERGQNNKRAAMPLFQTAQSDNVFARVIDEDTECLRGELPASSLTIQPWETAHLTPG
jgi:hypothetical protein